MKNSKLTIATTILALSLFSCNNQTNTNTELNQKEMITKNITYIPEGVCSKQMDISVVNDTIRSIVITKGCAGNTQGVSRLAEGMQIDDAIAKLEGIICGDKTTSCPDQLAKALKSMK
jgi:uncharacterized protein (TIGR03905 family)